MVAPACAPTAASGGTTEARPPGSGASAIASRRMTCAARVNANGGDADVFGHPRRALAPVGGARLAFGRTVKGRRGRFLRQTALTFALELPAKPTAHIPPTAHPPREPTAHHVQFVVPQHARAFLDLPSLDLPSLILAHWSSPLVQWKAGPLPRLGVPLPALVHEFCGS